MTFGSNYWGVGEIEGLRNRGSTVSHEHLLLFILPPVMWDIKKKLVPGTAVCSV